MFPNGYHGSNKTFKPNYEDDFSYEIDDDLFELIYKPQTIEIPYWLEFQHLKN